MSFWEEHYKSEAELQKDAPPSADKAAAGLSQNALIGRCVTCKEIKDDVLLGVCNGCFASYIAARR